MTLRERFHAIMKYRKPDRLPYMITLDLKTYHRARWSEQGMPPDCDPHEYFGIDEAKNNRATMWLNRGRGIEHIFPDMHALPRFEARPPRREEDFEFIYDIRSGTLHKRLLPRSKKDIRVKMLVEHAVNTYEEWLEYKKRFDPYHPRRYPRFNAIPHWQEPFPPDYPETWEEAAEDTKTATHIVMIGINAGFGGHGMDYEKFLHLIVDNPEWVREMNDHFGWFNREVAKKAVGTAQIDYFTCGGPDCDRNGNLVISPKMYFEYTEEDHRKNFTMAMENGIEYVELPDVRHLETEEKFIQLAQEAGLTPILFADGEGNFTVAERRKQYGKQFPIWKGMDTRELLGGQSAIDAMIDRVLTETGEGGYFPYMDDRFGNGYDVSFELFDYYTKAYRKAIGLEYN